MVSWQFTCLALGTEDLSYHRIPLMFRPNTCSSPGERLHILDVTRHLARRYSYRSLLFPVCRSIYELFRGAFCLLVALRNGNIRLYNDDKTLLHTLHTKEIIAGIRFGPYAREEGALAVVSTTGKLSIFMLHRKAALNKSSAGALTGAGSSKPSTSIGHPPEQDVPLKVRGQCVCTRQRICVLDPRASGYITIVHERGVL